MNNNIPDPTATTPIPLDRMPLKESKPPRKHRLGTGRVAIAIYTAIVGITLGAAVAEPTTTPAANEGPAPQPTVTVLAGLGSRAKRWAMCRACSRPSRT